MPLLAWFLGTKAGRILMAVGAASVAIGAAVLKAFLAGKSAERAKQDRADLDAHVDREKKDDEVAKLGAPDVDQRLDRWVRHD